MKQTIDLNGKTILVTGLAGIHWSKSGDPPAEGFTGRDDCQP
jgi:hypothetical protein